MTSSQETNLSLPQAIAMARQNFEAGELRACTYLCEKVLAAAPRHGMALHLMGLVNHRHGALERAVEFLEASLSAEPGNLGFISNAVEIFRVAGHPERSVELAQKAIDAKDATPSLLANVGLAKYDLGDLDGAKNLHARSLKLSPTHAASLNNLGSIARDEGALEDAVLYYRRVLNSHPTHFEAWNNLVTVMIDTDQLDAAQIEVTNLLRVAPENAEAMRSQARLSLLCNELDQAERLFKKALQLEPENIRAMVGLSQVLVEKNRAELALPIAQSAFDISTDDPLTCQQMANCLSTLGETACAIDHYERALAADANFVPALLGRGHIHLELGDTEAARSDFEMALAAQKDDISAMVALARIEKRASVDSPVFQRLEALLHDASTFSAQKAASYRYTLADCYHEQARYGDAFAQYALAAEQKRSLISYSTSENDQKVDAIIAVSTKAKLEAMKPFALTSNRPIFVLGMPRSGTTLTESILANHPDVHGAGELSDLQDVLNASVNVAANFPDSLGNLDGLALQGRMQSYLARLNKIDNQSRRITDKMPANFQLIGLIHALLPNAKIIHVKRDPMDICFSGFTRLFERSQLHSYDLTEMGRYYLGYQRLMDHWQVVLPNDAFHTIEYEALVADTESKSRELLDFAGLDWHPDCLQFHKSKRRIRTASVTQVRQKIYGKSVAKWRHYEQHLGPLKDVLEAGGTTID